MGLDTTHDCWHGSYGGFSMWRLEIAKALGWEQTTTTYGSNTYVIPEDRIPEQAPPADEERTDEDGETYTIRWSTYPNSVWLGHWDKDPDDVIDVLMVHGDSEGVIPHRFCRPLAERLGELMPEIGKAWQENGAYEPDYWGDITMQFITGLLKADMAGEDVGFH